MKEYDEEAPRFELSRREKIKHNLCVRLVHGCQNRVVATNILNMIGELIHRDEEGKAADVQLALDIAICTNKVKKMWDDVETALVRDYDDVPF